MKVGELFLAEFRKIMTNKGVLVSIIAVILVPLIYAGILLSPDWGPYDNLDNVPVAVVNNDEGAVSGDEQINVGNDLVENLKGNPTLGWDFVTSEEADKGLNNLKYFMVIEIPQDFSSDVVTVMDPTPIKPELKYTQNEGLHFMAAQVTEKAIETIQTQLATQITETYVRNVFDQLGGVTDGFQEAADGSEQIHDGSIQLKDGTTEILGALTGKSDDISKLATGAKELEDGTGEMLDSLTSKQGDISKLADGAGELNAGTGELLSNLQGKSGDISTLADGAMQVNDGTGLLLRTLREKSGEIKKLADGATELSTGAQKLKTGSTKLLKGAESAKSGSAQLKVGLDKQLVPGSEELAAGVQQAQDGVEETIGSMVALYDSLSFLSTLDKEHPYYDGIFNEVLSQLEASTNEKEIAKKKEDFQRLVNGANTLKEGLKEGSDFNAGLAQLDGGLSELVAGQKELNNGVADLNAGADQIADGNKTVKSGWDELAENVAILHDGTTQIKDGNATVKTGWGELTSGANQLHAGSSQINEGNQTVEAGWRELSTGSAQIHDGMQQVSDGTQTVETGWGDLTYGVTQVDDGIGEIRAGSDELTAGLKGGAEETSQLNPSDENMEMFAAPVELDGEVLNSFPFYRDSSAPYVMTLALFAGIFAMSFVLDFRKPAEIPVSGVSWFVGKTMNLSIFAILQAVIISTFTLVFLKLEVQSSLMFILFSIGVSLTFLMLIMFLVAVAGNVGRFIALAFIVLQLSTTGSDLPIHMLPEGLRNLSTFLPFTYSIDGYKNIVTLGKYTHVWSDIAVLSIYFIIFTGLALLTFLIKFRNIESDVGVEKQAS